VAKGRGCAQCRCLLLRISCLSFREKSGTPGTTVRLAILTNWPSTERCSAFAAAREADLPGRDFSQTIEENLALFMAVFSCHSPARKIEITSKSAAVSEDSLLERVIAAAKEGTRKRSIRE
jgi:hypothetical protein